MQDESDGENKRNVSRTVRDILERQEGDGFKQRRNKRGDRKER